MDELVEQLGAPQELVRPVLLLLLAESPGHGYELVQRLKAFGLEGQAASVYRDLRDLEKAGLTTSFWDASQQRGPARRVYELTPEGRRSLRGYAAAARDLISALASFVARWEVARSVRRRRRSPSGPPVRT